MPILSQREIDIQLGIAEMYIQEHLPGYKIQKKPLGVGATAAVFLIKNGSEKQAIKVFVAEIFQGEEAAAQRKRTKLQKGLIGHACSSLVTIESIKLYRNTCVCVMEYLPWKELKELIPSLPAEYIQALVDQLIDAVEYLALIGLVHRDIKPENILVSPDFLKLKIVDFGVAREISREEDRPDGTDHGKLKPFLATAQYSPPEYLFRTTEPSEALWNALNIYQISAVVHDMVTQKPIYELEAQSGNRYKLALAVLRDKPDLNSRNIIREPRLGALAQMGLTKDPELRSYLVKIEDFRLPKRSKASKLLAENISKLTNVSSTISHVSNLLETKQRICEEKLEALTALVLTSVQSNFNHSLKYNRVRSESSIIRKVFQIKLTGKDINWSFYLEIEQLKDVSASEIPVYLGIKNNQIYKSFTIGVISPEPEIVETSLTDRIFESLCDILNPEIKNILSQ